MGRFHGRQALERADPQILEKAQVMIGWKFKDLSLLALALLHKSCTDVWACSNEPLEFIGDALLDSTVDSYVSEKFPTLTTTEVNRMRGRLKSNRLLAIVAEEMDLSSVLSLNGWGIENFNQQKSRTKMMADFFEAILGALFIDGGREAMESFLARTLFLKAQEVFDDLDKSSLIETKFGKYLSPDSESSSENDPS